MRASVPAEATESQTDLLIAGVPRPSAQLDQADQSEERHGIVRDVLLVAPACGQSVSNGGDFKAKRLDGQDGWDDGVPGLS